MSNVTVPLLGLVWTDHCRTSWLGAVYRCHRRRLDDLQCDLLVFGVSAYGNQWNELASARSGRLFIGQALFRRSVHRGLGHRGVFSCWFMVPLRWIALTFYHASVGTDMGLASTYFNILDMGCAGRARTV